MSTSEKESSICDPAARNVVVLTNMDFFFVPLTKKCPAGLFKASAETVISKLNDIILFVIVYAQLFVTENPGGS